MFYVQMLETGAISCSMNLTTPMKFTSLYFLRFVLSDDFSLPERTEAVICDQYKSCLEVGT